MATESELYRLSRLLLSQDERGALMAAEEWLGQRQKATATRDALPERVLANLRREAHLAGDRSFGDPEALRAFLVDWAKAHAEATDDAERAAAFGGICRRYLLRGTRAPKGALPATLLRYVTSKRLAAELIRKVLGEQYASDFLGDKLPVEEAGELLERTWPTAAIPESLQLARGEHVFATFEHAGGAPRDEAEAMVDALALPCRATTTGDDEFLLEIAYPRDDVEEIRIPTVADAGDYPLFEAAPEVRPNPADRASCSGWSRPLAGQPAQPEVVHANRPLRVAARAPRLVGKISKRATS